MAVTRNVKVTTVGRGCSRLKTIMMNVRVTVLAAADRAVAALAGWHHDGSHGQVATIYATDTGDIESRRRRARNPACRSALGT